MTTISPSPLPAATAVPASPGPNPEAATKAVQAAAPQPQAGSSQPQTAAVPPSDPMLNALQKVMAAEAALMQSVNAALPTAAASQGGLAPLMADLIQAQQMPDLPAVLQAAIVEVLALRSPLDTEITGADIKAALAKSGLLSEAKAAVGLQATNTAAQIPPAATDIKTALLVLRQVLRTWLSDNPAHAQAASSAKDVALPAARAPANNPPQPTYRSGAPNNTPPPMPPAPTATILEGAAKPALPASMPPQATTISSPDPVTEAPQNPATAGAPTAVLRHAAMAYGPQASPTSAETKTAPVLQQSRSGQPAAPAETKHAAPEPSLRTPLNNPAPPTARAPNNFQPPVASASLPPTVAVTNASEVPKPAPAGTSPPQAQITPSPEAMTESSPQVSKAELPANLSQAAAPSAGTLPPGTDVKAATIIIQQFLKASLDSLPTQPYAPEAGKNPGPEPQRPAANNPPPPYRGGPTSAQPSLAPTLAADANPRIAGEVLLNHTEAALAHLKLLQIASLPDAPPGSPHHEDQASRWMFEIPFSTPQGSAIGQFEIRRDGRGAGAEQSGPVWRARFSLAVEPIGPVHAQVVLMGGRAWVTLWAEREASVHILRDKEALLSEALKDSDVVPEVAFFFGTPNRPAAAAGQFVDRAS